MPKRLKGLELLGCASVRRLMHPAQAWGAILIWDRGEADILNRR